MAKKKGGEAGAPSFREDSPIQDAERGKKFGFGSGDAMGSNKEGTPVQRGSFGGNKNVGNRGDYSFLGASGEEIEFFGDQDSGIPGGTGAHGERASGLGGGYAESTGSSRGTAGAARPSHAGKSPKGWKRTDERMQEDINERLTRHPELDASDIEVRVKGGVATLSGEVDDKRAKWTAEDVCLDCVGVRDVDNRLRVRNRGKRLENDKSFGDTRAP